MPEPTPPVAVVTGAARGIGAATALRLARSGWALLLVDLCADDPVLSYGLSTSADLERSASACREQGAPAVTTAVADVRDRREIEAALALGAHDLGGLDAAIAVAGAIAGGIPAWETSEAVWHDMLAVNLTGVWHLMAAAVPLILERPRPRHGRLVAVASAGALVGLPKLAAYVAAKHGVVGLMRSLAAELGGQGVTANAVCPGSTDTAMIGPSASFYGLDNPAELAVHHLDQRLLQPAEIAEAIGWLCSPAASGVTGAVFPVDAGMTAR
jgi:SDR family mycofactocin-dependent oxidoreductase